MSDKYKYEIKNIGLGDLTFFCGEMLLKLKKEDVLLIKLNEFTLSNYKKNSIEYKNFCINYIKYILSDYTVLECGDEVPDRQWEINSHHIDSILTNSDVRNLFKTKFSSGLINNQYSNYVVLFTKVRDYDRNRYNAIANKFYEKLNLIDSKIILLGEKKVHYDGEYSHHGENKIYSLYYEYIKNINPEKIIDLTQEDYTESNVILENIINDLTLISNSKQMIMIGNGGFWCTSLFTDKLISLNSDAIPQSFSFDFNKQIFFDLNKFIDAIYYV
jgi:hypothetical protein